MSIQWNNELYHYGMPRRSGRYKWGSGKNPRAARRAERKEKKKEYKDVKKTIKSAYKSNYDTYITTVNGINRSAKQGTKEAKKLYKTNEISKSDYKNTKAWNRAVSNIVKDHAENSLYTKDYAIRKQERKLDMIYAKEVKGIDSKAYKKGKAKYKQAKETFGYGNTIVSVTKNKRNQYEIYKTAYYM